MIAPRPTHTSASNPPPLTEMPFKADVSHTLIVPVMERYTQFHPAFLTSTRYQELTDQELVTRCQTELPANRCSYETLVQRHRSQVYRWVHRVVRNREEAEDITQDVFIKVYEHLITFEQKASFSTWLYRIAINSAIDALDKISYQHKKVVSLSSLGEEKQDVFHLSLSSTVEPVDHAIQMELQEGILRAFAMLNREQADLLFMCCVDGMSYAEIATILGIGKSAVKMRIQRARRAFHHSFHQQY